MTSACMTPRLFPSTWTTSSKARPARPRPRCGLRGCPAARRCFSSNAGAIVGPPFLLNQPVTTAGRLPGSDIFLDDITVSRRHAEFQMGDGQHRIVDTGSLNKTYVNGRPVESAILANGDQIQIGKFRLVFLNAAPTS